MDAIEMKRLSLPATGNLEILWNSRAENVSIKDPSTDEHIHPCYEIYVYLRGEVSFAMNNTVYELRPGDVIVTRPHTSHHCIPHADCKHEHYCIFIYCNDSLLQQTLELLADRGLLRFRPKETKDLLTLLQQITQSLTRVPLPSALEQRTSLYRLISQLTCDTALDAPAPHYPENLSRILQHISIHYAGALSIRELCKQFFISQATLERLFRHYLNTTPYRYILQCRLSAAALALAQGKSVGTAAEEGGFSDYPHFIAQFRKSYGMTPNQYKRAHFHS